MASVASRAQPTPQGLGSQKLLPMVDHGGAGLGCSTKNIHTHPTVIHSENPDLLSTVLHMMPARRRTILMGGNSSRMRLTFFLVLDLAAVGFIGTL